MEKHLLDGKPCHVTRSCKRPFNSISSESIMLSNIGRAIPLFIHTKSCARIHFVTFLRKLLMTIVQQLSVIFYTISAQERARHQAEVDELTEILETNSGKLKSLQEDEGAKAKVQVQMTITNC